MEFSEADPGNIPVDPVDAQVFMMPEELDYKLALWMKANSYSLRSVKEYCTCVKALMGGDQCLTIPKIKAYLSRKNTLLKRASVKLLITFLEEVHNIRIPQFTFPRLIQKKVAKERALTKEEISKLVEAIKPKFKVFLKLMYYGGLRAKEIISVRREAIDWATWITDKEQHGDLKIIKGKWNRERIVPLRSEIIKEVFDIIPKRADETLIKGMMFDFGYEKYIKKKVRSGFSEDVAEMRYVHKVYRTFVTALNNAAEISLGKKIKTHNIRSARATHLDQAGVPITTIQEILGHGDLKTTSRYINNTTDKVRRDMVLADE